MAMTITEKILAAHAGKATVSPGDLITARVDLCLGNDITAPLAIDVFEEAGADSVFDADKVVLVCDHFTPNKDIKSANQCRRVREFGKTFGLTHVYDGGCSGVEHALLPELGLVAPGDLIIGADSHTCTYGGLSAFATGVGSTDLAAVMMTGEVWLRVPESMKFVLSGVPRKWVTGKDYILAVIGDIGVDGALYRAMEFAGDAVGRLSVEERLTVANMAIEAGGKNGIFPADDKTTEYLAGKTDTALNPSSRAIPAPSMSRSASTTSRNWSSRWRFPISRPTPSRSATCPDIPIDQVIIGSCTNGRISDLRMAAQIIQGRKVHPDVRLIVIPATPAVWRQAMDEGLFTIFLDAGAVIGPPTCGPCLGGHMGILGEGERAVATTNRNFQGRMGDPGSEVYLAGPAVAAASAVVGKVAGPDRLGL